MVTYTRQAPIVLGAPVLGEVDVLDQLGKIATAVKWTGIGILALAGAVVVFKILDLVAD